MSKILPINLNAIMLFGINIIDGDAICIKKKLK
jgi:hypothetical protein